MKLLNLQFFTNTQIVPEISSDLRDDLALAPDLQFMPQLTIQQINNCSEEELQLKSNQEILTLNFPTKQILGINLKLHLSKNFKDRLQKLCSRLTFSPYQNKK